MNRWILPFLAFLACWIVPISAAHSQDTNSLPEAIRRSPDNYVSGVVEIHGRVECLGEGRMKRCYAPAYLIEEYASRLPNGEKFPRKFWLGVAGEAGTQMFNRSLILAIPTDPDFHYASVKACAYGPNAARRFKQWVELALTGRGDL